MRAALLLPLVFAVGTRAQENPLAPAGKPIPASPAPADAACGGFVDAERGLSLALWEGRDGGLEGELAVARRAFPVRLSKAAMRWKGTFQADGHTFPIEVESASTGQLVIASAGARYTLVRSMTAAQLGEVRAQMEQLTRKRAEGNEAFAFAALRTITTAQALFREGDKEKDGSYDYASSLEELARAKLIDAGLGSGTKQGYRFELRAGDPIEFLWAATASPVETGAGGKWFFVNHEGIVYYTSRGPIALPADCKLPRGLTPAGMEEGSHDQAELDAIMGEAMEGVKASQGYPRATGAAAQQLRATAKTKLTSAIGRMEAFLGRPQYRVDGEIRPEFSKYEGFRQQWAKTLAELERGSR